MTPNRRASTTAKKAPGQPTLLTNVGLDPGWSSLFIMSPATGDGVVILTNSDNGAPAIAQILSIWTAWRGLPASNLNSGYRWFGVSAAVFLSLLAALDVAYAGSLAMELSAGGRRRIGLSRRSPISGGLLELAVAATVLALWAGVFAAVRSMPTMHAVGVSVIGALVVLALARTLFPLNEPHGASKPVAVGARRWGRPFRLRRDAESLPPAGVRDAVASGLSLARTADRVA